LHHQQFDVALQAPIRWLDGSHVSRGILMIHQWDLEKKNILGVEKTPETISMENTGTTRNLSEVFFSQEICFVGFFSGTLFAAWLLKNTP